MSAVYQLIPRPKYAIIELTAVKVAGKKNTVMAAMILITLLSREVDSAMLCDDCARLVLVLAKRRLIAESRCAIPL